MCEPIQSSCCPPPVQNCYPPPAQNCCPPPAQNCCPPPAQNCGAPQGGCDPCGQNQACLRDWHYGLCYTCRDCQSCCEALFCPYCQLSRQCNMLSYRAPCIYWPYCCLLWCLDPMTCGVLSCIAAAQTRSYIRRRYGIRGSELQDLCLSWMCRCCVIQQILLEMTSMSEFPGATCYRCPKIPAVCSMS